MNIDSLTIGEAKQLAALFQSSATANDGIAFCIGEKVIIRTYSAGVWFGTLTQKSGKEVILSNARRLWVWHAKEGISLSAVAMLGILHAKSRVAIAVAAVWIEAIEILPCSATAIASIEGAENAKAQ